MTEPFVVRPATEDDLEAIDAVHRAHDDPPEGAVGLEPGAHVAYFRHLLERGTLLVAEAGGRVVGFGASIDTGRSVHLADLFVLPERLGQGIGKRLLDGVFADRWPRTTFASDDPRAMPLYIRAGMRPYWPNLYLTGSATGLPAADGLVVESATAADLAELELGWTGIDRSEDHERWVARNGNTAFVVRSGGHPVAAGHVRDRIRGTGRWLDRLIAEPGLDASGPILAALQFGTAADGVIGCCLPGPNPLLGTLIDARFRIADHDTFMASDAALVDTSWILGTGIP